jgi:hypothetical protein
MCSPKANAYLDFYAFITSKCELLSFTRGKCLRFLFKFLQRYQK